MSHEGLSLQYDAVQERSEIGDVWNQCDVAVVDAGSNHEQLSRLGLGQFNVVERFQLNPNSGGVDSRL